MAAASVQIPHFDTVSDALAQARVPIGAAEAHGSLCGALCLLGERAVAPWVAEILADLDTDDLAVSTCADYLLDLARSTGEMLEAGDMEFVPFLPDDEDALGRRVEALGTWCQGFMHGLIAAASADVRPVLEEGVTEEILQDFSQITRAGVAPDDAAEEGEAAYFELVEYVRVSGQLVYEETCGVRGRREPDDGSWAPDFGAR